jgi:hypothetical protein
VQKRGNRKGQGFWGRQRQAFGRIAAGAFDLGDAVVPWLARMPGRPGWHVFMCFDAIRRQASARLVLIHLIAMPRTVSVPFEQHRANGAFLTFARKARCYGRSSFD